MSLRDVLDEIAVHKKAHLWLLPPLLESVASSREVAPPKADTWFSVSRVPTMCPRALVMASRLALPLSDDIDAQSRWSMDRGTALHSVMRERWLGPTGWLYGGWQCPACAQLHGGDGKSTWSVVLVNAVPLPEKCERCGHAGSHHEPFHFIEPNMVNAELRVRGRSDGFLRMPAYGFEIMDLKFTSRLDLVRVAARPADVAQVNWYLDGSGLRTGRLVYVDPGSKEVAKSMIEHKVDFDAALMHSEKEKVRVTREALGNPAKAVPACPYGGKSPYGQCNCVEMAVLWTRHGARSGARS
jgi:hypothetical protein